MKFKMKYLIIVMALCLGFSSCDNDDDNDDVTIEVIETDPIVLDNNELALEVGQTGTVNVSSGGGEYTVFSSNPDIATASIEGSAVTINTLDKGIVSVIVTDKNDQIAEIQLTSMYMEIIFEQPEVELELLKGHYQNFSISVVQGNGEYEASTESEIIEVSVDGDDIVVTAMKEGTAVIKVTDSRNLEAELTVVITETLNPWTENLLAEIMESDDDAFVINSSSVNTSHVTCINTVEDGLNKYGWDYYGHYYYFVYWAGDKTVGSKTDGQFKYYFGRTFDEPVDFEIIKNDGFKIWGIFSFLKDEKVNYGYFCYAI